MPLPLKLALLLCLAILQATNGLQYESVSVSSNSFMTLDTFELYNSSLETDLFLDSSDINPSFTTEHLSAFTSSLNTDDFDVIFSTSFISYTPIDAYKSTLAVLSQLTTTKMYGTTSSFDTELAMSTFDTELAMNTFDTELAMSTFDTELATSTFDTELLATSTFDTELATSSFDTELATSSFDTELATSSFDTELATSSFDTELATSSFDTESVTSIKLETSKFNVFESSSSGSIPLQPVSSESIDNTIFTEPVSSEFIGTIFSEPVSSEFIGTIFPEPVSSEFIGTIFPEPVSSEFIGTIFPEPVSSEFIGTIFPEIVTSSQIINESINTDDLLLPASDSSIEIFFSSNIIDDQSSSIIISKTDTIIETVKTIISSIDMDSIDVTDYIISSFHSLTAMTTSTILSSSELSTKSFQSSIIPSSRQISSILLTTPLQSSTTQESTMLQPSTASLQESSTLESMQLLNISKTAILQPSTSESTILQSSTPESTIFQPSTSESTILQSSTSESTILLPSTVSLEESTALQPSTTSLQPFTTSLQVSTMVQSSTSSSPQASITNIISEPSDIVRMILVLSEQESTLLADDNSSERAQLENDIINVYLQGLDILRGNRKRQTLSAQITNVGSLNTGVVPIDFVDFFIAINSEPVEAYLVIGAMTKANPQTIGNNYEVIGFVSLLQGTTTVVAPTTEITFYTTLGLAAISVILVLILMLLAFSCIVVYLKRKKSTQNAVEVFQTHQLEPELIQNVNRDTVGVQHGTPAIEKLSRGSGRAKRNVPSSSTLALLASSSETHLDAWQNNQLEVAEEPEAFDGQGVLFEHVTHFADKALSHRPHLLKFHTEVVPQASNLEGLLNKEIQLPKTKGRDRVKIVSQQPEQAQQMRESEGEGGMGDAEGSDEGKSTPTPPRPHTTKKKKRKLNGRGVPIVPITTDVYEESDHRSKMTPSRQSRKYPAGRNMRARPLTQGTTSSRMARHTAYDAKRELAWMSTNDGVQLVSIQPLESGNSQASVGSRDSWQHLPRLSTHQRMDGTSTYSRQQLQELLQLHKELELVEQGIKLSRGSLSNLTPESSGTPHKDVPSAYSAEEIALQAFSKPTMHPSMTVSSSYPIQQLLWTPAMGGVPIQAQPLGPSQLTRLRHNPNLGLVYPQDVPYNNHTHPFQPDN